MEELLELINDGFGEDVKYEDNFTDLIEEIEKLSSPALSDTVDFNKIKSLGETILKTQSKDFVTAIYYSFAVLKLDDFQSFEKTICFISEFIQKFWENGFPKREKAKINALNWWIKKIEVFVDNLKPITSNPENMIKCLENIENYFDDVNLITIKNTINQKIKKPVQKTTPQQEVKTEEVEISPLEEYQKLSEKLNETISKLVETDYNPEYFMISRMIIFNDINELPITQNNNTLLPAPSSQEKNIIENLYKNKEYKSLLELCESKINSYIFWFDLHYYVSISLKNLNFEVASEAVKFALQLLFKKLPELLNYNFTDGTPFATNETKKWLNPPTQSSSSTTKNRYEIPSLSQTEKITFIQNKILTSATMIDKINWWLVFFEVFENSSEIIEIYVNELDSLLKNFKIDKIDIELAKKSYLTIILNTHNEQLKQEYIDKLALIDANSLNGII